ncbi:MAG: galactoside O-acetyltransferase, partial [Armatimonadetes bacterium]|nr:galactoside O-acetyltransferase [Armatimonadota bacterium]
MRSIGLALLLAGKALQRLHMIALMPPFRSHGRAFRFDPRGVYTFQTISVGDNVNLGLRATMIASLSEIRMGDNIMFGPDVVVIGGGHSIYVLGEFMANVTEKSPTDDR